MMKQLFSALILVSTVWGADALKIWGDLNTFECKTDEIADTIEKELHAIDLEACKQENKEARLNLLIDRKDNEFKIRAYSMPRNDALSLKLSDLITTHYDRNDFNYMSSQSVIKMESIENRNLCCGYLVDKRYVALFPSQSKTVSIIEASLPAFSSLSTLSLAIIFKETEEAEAYEIAFDKSLGFILRDWACVSVTLSASPLKSIEPALALIDLGEVDQKAFLTAIKERNV